MILWLLVFAMSVQLAGGQMVQSPELIGMFATERECQEVKRNADLDAYKKNESKEINPQIQTFGSTCVPIKLDTNNKNAEKSKGA